MNAPLFVSSILGPVYLTLGLSIVLYPKTWQKLVKSFATDHFQLFTMMFCSLVLGLLMIRTYNVWEWNVYLIVTITGWGAFLKGTLYMLLPGAWIKSLLEWKAKMMGLLICGGLVLLLAGAALSYMVYLA